MDDANVLVSTGGEVAWWTFAGGRANTALAHELGRRLDMRVTSDNFVIRFPPQTPLAPIEQEIGDLAAVDPGSLRAPVSDSARDAMKFAECLPVERADRVVQERLADPATVAGCLRRSLRVVIAEEA